MVMPQGKAVAQPPATNDGAGITVYAAGSLRGALSAVAKDFEAATGTKVNFVFGASGLLRDRLQGGEAADVFASANMEHPQALHAAGKAKAPRAFARNALCALTTPSFDLRGKTLAQRLLDDDVKVGTSTPKADPSGDYAFEMFDRIERSGAAAAGSAERLKAKALQLTGGPQSPPPPADRNVYGELVTQGKADVFVTVLHERVGSPRGAAGLAVASGADAINVLADYGLGAARRREARGRAVRRSPAVGRRAAPPRGVRLLAALVTRERISAPTACPELVEGSDQENRRSP